MLPPFTLIRRLRHAEARVLLPLLLLPLALYAPPHAIFFCLLLLMLRVYAAADAARCLLDNIRHERLRRRMLPPDFAAAYATFRHGVILRYTGAFRRFMLPLLLPRRRLFALPRHAAPRAPACAMLLLLRRATSIVTALRDKPCRRVVAFVVYAPVITLPSRHVAAGSAAAEI